MRTLKRAAALALLVYFGFHPAMGGIAAFCFWLADRLEGK